MAPVFIKLRVMYISSKYKPCKVSISFLKPVLFDFTHLWKVYPNFWVINNIYFKRVNRLKNPCKMKGANVQMIWILKKLQKFSLFP